MASYHHDPETLLAQDGFLRRLASSLVRDAAHADDLVQDAWLAALRRRGGPQRLQAWLAGAVRHLASKGRRGEVRRAERERRAARPEALPSADAILSRESARQSVVRAVLELDEPYRTTLILRYLDDLPPRRVAQMLSVPVETVRTRIKRALEQLRARMDREHGERSNWAMLLVPIGAMAMTTRSKVACAVVGLVLSAVLAFGAAQMLGVGVTDEAGEPAGGVVAAAALPHASDAARAEAPTSRIAVLSAPASPPGSSLCALRVHVVWGEDHTPAEGVHVRLVQWEDPEFYRERRVREVVTPAAGTFVLRELRPWNSCLYGDRGGSARVGLRPGEETEAELEIPPGALVVGTVATKDGAPVAGAVVQLTGDDAVLVPVATTAADGSFAVRSIGGGGYLGASAAGYGESLRHNIDGRAGETVRMKLLLAPECELAGQVLDAAGRPQPGAAVLVGTEGRAGAPERSNSPDTFGLTEPPARQVTTDHEGRFLMRGLRPRAVEVAVFAPGHAPWFGANRPVPGERVAMTIRLEPGATLRGRVTDGADHPIPGTRVAVCQENPHNAFAQMQCVVGADGTFEFQHLDRHRFLVWAISPDLASARQLLRELPDLPGGELRWDPVLKPGPQLRGRVVDEQGRPLAHWSVRATVAGEDTPLSPRGGDRTLADGTFTIRNCRNVPATLEVFEASAFQVAFELPVATRTDVRPGGDEVCIQVLASARGTTAHIVGRIAHAIGSPPERATIGIERRGDARSESVGNHRATGRFEAHVPPGDYRIAASCTDAPAYQSAEHHLAAGETWDLGDIPLPAPGTLLVTLPAGREVNGWDLLITGTGVRDRDRLGVQGVEARSGPLAAGDYVLHVATPGFAFGTLPFTIRGGAETRLVLTCEPGLEQRLHLLEPAGMAASEGTVTIQRAAGTLVHTRPWPVDWAQPMRVWLAPGAYRVVLTRGGQSCAGELTVRSGAASTSEVTDVQLR